MRRVIVHRIRKELRFEAAHVLSGLAPDHPCSRMHGHSYRFVVEMVGTELDSSGFLLDFNLLKPIRNRLDHQTLNDILPKGLNPTAENLAYYIYTSVNDLILKLDAVEDVKVERVGVWETETSYAEVEALDVED